jgi:hypothetical protein
MLDEKILGAATSGEELGKIRENERRAGKVGTGFGNSVETRRSEDEVEGFQSAFVTSVRNGNHMRRSFLFGLSWFLIIATIFPWVRLLEKPAAAIGIITPLIFGPPAILLRQLAKRSPPNTSKLNAVLGWWAGFLAISPVILAGVGVWWLFRA